MDVQVRQQLELEIAAIQRDCTAPRAAPIAEHVPARPKARYSPAPLPEGRYEREPFGRWLIIQKDRGDWIDALAETARRDPSFPKLGDPDDVREHLRKMGADGDAFEQVDDAELDWLSL